MTTHTSDSIITTIKEKNIRPKSRIYFMVTHAALWVPGVMVTLLGAFATTVQEYIGRSAGKYPANDA